MTSRFRELSPARLLAMGMRASSMAGRLLFVSAAAFFLPLVDLGRFGVLVSLELLLTALVGLEIYQSVNRDLASGQAGDKTRRDYLAFAVVGSAVAGAFAFATLTVMQWSGWPLVSGRIIVASEHFGTELFRMLVIEKRSNAALYAFSLRSGSWAIALPLISLLKLLPSSWSLTLVLMSWAGASLAATSLVLALPSSYRLSSAAFARLPHWVWAKRATIMTWVLVAMGWRILENGGRVVAANSLGYSAAGIFTLLTTLSTISLNLQKAFIEPILFADLGRPERNKARQQLMLWAMLLGIIGVIGGLIVLYVYDVTGRVALDGAVLAQYGLLSLLSLALMLSQGAHFTLYAKGADLSVLRASLAGAIVGVPLALLGAKLYGGMGIAGKLARGNCPLGSESC